MLFAFSISISTCYLWFWPLISLARQSNIENSFTLYPKLSIMVYILVSAVVAPLLIAPMLSSTMGTRFEQGLKREILQQDTETKT